MQENSRNNMICACVNVFAARYLHVFVCVSAFVCVFLNVHVYVCMQMCVHLVCIHVCVCPDTVIYAVVI